MEEVIVRDEMQKAQRERISYLSMQLDELMKNKPGDPADNQPVQTADVVTRKEGEIDE